MQEAHSWEPLLLAMANEALRSSRLHLNPFTGDEDALEKAHKHCKSLTAFHSRSFHLASSLLPSHKRRAVRALYAFCRVTDDIVDNNEPSVAAVELKAWRERAFAPSPPSEDQVAIAWAETRSRFNIPLRFAEQLIEGVARDLAQDRYQSFADLATYSYGVASTVGLISMHIIGNSGPEAVPYAIKLGLALQMTNILRDVAEDWQRGRVYLPQDELSAFGLTEGVIAGGRVTDQWRSFMRFQIERNHRLYQEGRPGIGMLDKDGRLAITAATGFYQAILDDIEQHDYDVFSRRAHIGGWEKLRRLPHFWRQSRQIIAPSS